jgi:hypothetical protein
MRMEQKAHVGYALQENSWYAYAMKPALFRAEGTQILPLPVAVSPWMPEALSGAAIGPLITALSEDVPTPCAMMTTRICVEFLRPVPMRALDVATEIVREGRKQQILRIQLGAGGKDSVRATILRIRTQQSVPAEPVPDYVPPSFEAFTSSVQSDNPLCKVLDCYRISSNNYGPGISEMWVRFRGTVLEGRPVTPLVRAGLFADFGNGISAIARSEDFSFMNADISLHLARVPQGEWLNLRARTLAGGNGLAVTCTEIADARGLAGWSHQSLLIEPRS